MRQQQHLQHPDSEDFLMDEDDGMPSHSQTRRSSTTTSTNNALSRKLHKNKDASQGVATGNSFKNSLHPHLKKSPLFHHVPPGSSSSSASSQPLLDAKKLLRIKTRIQD